MPNRHVVLPGSHRPAHGDRVHDADPQAQVEVTLDLRAPKLPNANELPQKALTPAEFARRYGSSQEDADKVKEVLERYGLKVQETSLPTNSMRVSGSVAAMNSAFQSKLGIYRSPAQGLYRGRQGDLEIPAELAGIIEGVIGLDERQVARRKAANPRRAAVAPTLSPVTPADLESRYNFPPGDAAGQTIAIAEFGGGYFASDLTAYCAKQQRPVPNVIPVPVNAPAYTLRQIQQLPRADQQDALDDAVEVMMDIQVVAGLCPGATIVVYFASFDQKGWVDLLNQVIAGQPALPVSLSVSWGLAEDDPDWSAGALDAINQRLNAVALLGITVCVSSGDDGSGDQVNDGRAHVDFPGCSPFVLSVGGTMLTDPSTEVVWWEAPGRRTRKGGGSGGGGVSVFYERPTWQNVQIQSLNAGSIDGRVIPDIAALAGDPLYDLIFMGADQPNGGTSASAPLWAALIARMNANLPAAKQQRFLTPLLYGNGPTGQPVGAAGCRDITVGNNISRPQPAVGYQAGTGFDAVSGWGVPIGTALLGAL